MLEPTVVAQRVKERRTARGLKREQVAVMAGVSISTVDNLEQGRRLPRIETLDRIAGVLGVSVSDLLAAWRRPAAA